MVAKQGKKNMTTQSFVECPPENYVTENIVEEKKEELTPAPNEQAEGENPSKKAKKIPDAYRVLEDLCRYTFAMGGRLAPAFLRWVLDTDGKYLPKLFDLKSQLDEMQVVARDRERTIIKMRAAEKILESFGYIASKDADLHHGFEVAFVNKLKSGEVRYVFVNAPENMIEDVESPLEYFIEVHTPSTDGVSRPSVGTMTSSWGDLANNLLKYM